MWCIALAFDPSIAQFVKIQPPNDKIKFLYKVVNVKLSTGSFYVIAQKDKVKKGPVGFSANLSTKDLLPICCVR
jgi:hypothetical protein